MKYELLFMSMVVLYYLYGHDYVVFINRSRSRFYVSVMCGLSGHILILFTCAFTECSLNKPVVKYVEDFKPADNHVILDKLWNLADNMPNADPCLMWNCFKLCMKLF